MWDALYVNLYFDNLLRIKVAKSQQKEKTEKIYFEINSDMERKVKIEIISAKLGKIGECIDVVPNVANEFIRKGIAKMYVEPTPETETKEQIIEAETKEMKFMETVRTKLKFGRKRKNK
jgi:hypothetical protein